MSTELSALLADLRQSRALVGAEELRLRRPAQSPTRLPELDALLGGGLPSGRIVELSGQGGAAATAIAVRLLANATTEGWPAALVDRPFAFDPRSAAEAGVDLGRLLWCRPGSLDEAARAVDAILGSGAFPLVVLDLGEPREKPRSRKDNLPLAESAWVRLARRAEAARATLVVLAEGRHRPAAMAAASLQAVRQRARFAGTGPGRTFEGLEVTVGLVRNKLGLPPGQARVQLGAPAHFAEQPREESTLLSAALAAPAAPEHASPSRPRRGRRR